MPRSEFPGFFVTLDGVDGTGKSTQCRLLLEGLRTVGAFCVDGVTPDLMLLLDLPIEAACKRLTRAQDRLERRGADYHERVRQGFLAEARVDPERRLVVDASPTVEELHAARRE